MTLKKINILEYAFREGGGGHQKAYAVYAFINVDNCERPLSLHLFHTKAGVCNKLPLSNLQEGAFFKDRIQCSVQIHIYLLIRLTKHLAYVDSETE